MSNDLELGDGGLDPGLYQTLKVASDEFASSRRQKSFDAMHQRVSSSRSATQQQPTDYDNTLFDDSYTSLSSSTLRSVPYVAAPSSNSHRLDLPTIGGAPVPVVPTNVAEKAHTSSSSYPSGSGKGEREREGEVTDKSRHRISNPEANSSSSGSSRSVSESASAGESPLQHPSRHRDTSASLSMSLSRSRSRSQSQSRSRYRERVAALESAETLISNDDDIVRQSSSSSAAAAAAHRQPRVKLTNVTVVDDEVFKSGDAAVAVPDGSNEQHVGRGGGGFFKPGANVLDDDVFKRGSGTLLIDDVIVGRGGAVVDDVILGRGGAVVDDVIFGRGGAVVDDVISPRGGGGGGSKSPSNQVNGILVQGEISRPDASAVVVDIKPHHDDDEQHLYQPQITITSPEQLSHDSLSRSGSGNSPPSTSSSPRAASQDDVKHDEMTNPTPRGRLTSTSNAESNLSISLNEDPIHHSGGAKMLGVDLDSFGEGSATPRGPALMLGDYSIDDEPPPYQEPSDEECNVDSSLGTEDVDVSIPSRPSAGSRGSILDAKAHARKPRKIVSKQKQPQRLHSAPVIAEDGFAVGFDNHEIKIDVKDEKRVGAARAPKRGSIFSKLPNVEGLPLDKTRVTLARLVEDRMPYNIMKLDIDEEWSDLQDKIKRTLVNVPEDFPRFFLFLLVCFPLIPCFAPCLFMAVRRRWRNVNPAISAKCKEINDSDLMQRRRIRFEPGPPLDSPDVPSNMFTGPRYEYLDIVFPRMPEEEEGGNEHPLRHWVPKASRGCAAELVRG